jgi:arsenate reductase
MAEAFLNKFGKDHFIAESAGIEPGTLNPNVVEVMKEIDIDISNKNTQGVFDLLSKGKTYNAVITVCDEASAERCPIFPGATKTIAWSFADPSAFRGDHAEVLEKTRKVRDEIREKIMEFIKDASQLDYWVKPSVSRTK